MDEEDKYSPSEFWQFYYPGDLETSDVEIERGISEIQEVIDDFINKRKTANPNKKTAPDTDTLFSATWKLTVWQTKELNTYLHRSLTTFCPNFFM